MGEKETPPPEGRAKAKAEEAREEKAERHPSAKKGKEKWRAKEWYRVFAPDMFGGQQVAETLAADPNSLPGRVVSVSLQEVTGDFSKMHIKLKLRINKVSGFDAHTIFIGHDLTSDYIRRLTRRKHSKMDGVFTVRTKDGFTVKVKPMAITEKRIQTSQQSAIRNLMSKVITSTSEKQTLGELIRDILQGEMAKLIFKECKPIYPIRKIEIRRTEVIGFPEPDSALPSAIAPEAPPTGAPSPPGGEGAGEAPAGEGIPEQTPNPPAPPASAPDREKGGSAGGTEEEEGHV
ncbi:MAG: 30S ribosomal protein S3ae [Thermoplasmata archaeon]